MNIPNSITIGRLVLALIVFALLLNTHYYWLCFVLTGLVILGDFFDGYFARRLGQSTRLGAWLDIAGDRFVELGYWAVFAVLGQISVWVLLIFLLRGLLVDGIRSFAESEGHTAFGNSSMMQSWWGIALVSSRFSRFTYAVVKVICFMLLILGLQYFAIQPFANYLSWFTTLFCIIRGIPVLLEGWQYVKN